MASVDFPRLPRVWIGTTILYRLVELPPEDWFTIKSIVRDLELQERDWAADLRGGYFCQASAPWER